MTQTDLISLSDVYTQGRPISATPRTRKYVKKGNFNYEDNQKSVCDTSGADKEGKSIVTISGLSYGYYLVTSTVGTVDSTTPNVETTAER